MSRVRDPYNNEYYLEEVQRYCLYQLDQFVIDQKKSITVRSWPMDYISDQPYGYTIHCSLVEDWNRENRQTECVDFHRKWLENEDNIRRALERKW